MEAEAIARPPKTKRIFLGLVALVVTAVGAIIMPRIFPTVYGSHSIADRVKQYGPAARARWAPTFSAAGVTYPPARVTLVGLKRERTLRVYAGDAGGPLRLVATYPVLGASGSIGPKLREGDRQVPEGIYAIESLNPNSRYHLALRVSYPNAFDRARAHDDGRTALGGDIMIHGGSASVGCLAMGDEAAEDLFVLAAECGIQNVRVILAPCDLRSFEPPADAHLPPWTAALYESVWGEINSLPIASEAR